MILNDYSLHTRAERGMVKPYNSNHLQGCSIDLTLGPYIQIETGSDEEKAFRALDLSERGPYQMAPGEFLLAHTSETISIPDDCCGDLVLRSSAARAGFDHCLSGLIDPCFEGELTLELRNNLRNHTLDVYPGMRICQLVVHKLNYQSYSPYAERGHYQHQTGARLSNYNFKNLAA